MPSGMCLRCGGATRRAETCMASLWRIGPIVICLNRKMAMWSPLTRRNMDAATRLLDQNIPNEFDHLSKQTGARKRARHLCRAWGLWSRGQKYRRRCGHLTQQTLWRYGHLTEHGCGDMVIRPDQPKVYGHLTKRTICPAPRTGGCKARPQKAGFNTGCATPAGAYTRPLLSST